MTKRNRLNLRIAPEWRMLPVVVLALSFTVGNRRLAAIREVGSFFAHISFDSPAECGRL